MSRLILAIARLVVSGGIISVWGVYGATEAAADVLKSFSARVRSSAGWRDLLEAFEFLYRAYRERPYSALLANTARHVMGEFLAHGAGDFETASKRLLESVDRILGEVEVMTENASLIASKRISGDETIITISYSGTVLRVFKNLVSRGLRVKALVAESRPLGEGVEMAKALRSLGVETTLVVDSALRSFARRASRVLMGCEAIASNGAVINKVGSSLLALVAREARLRVFVVSGSYKIFPETVFGELVDSPEVEVEIPWDLKRLGVRLSAPLFEAVPPEYIDAIATEKGLVSPAAIPYIVRESFGSWPPRVRRVEDIYDDLRRRLEGVAGFVRGPS